DTDLKIVYMNPASTKVADSVSKWLPVPVPQMIGSTIDIFHKDPSYQRKLLANEKNLPLRANIEIGPETADLLGSALYAGEGHYIGPMVTWELISEKLRAENELARTKAIAENAPTAVMLATTDLDIVYINPAARTVFKKLEKYLPVSMERIVGTNIDVFHKNPA